MTTRSYTVRALVAVILPMMGGLSSCQKAPDPKLNGAWQDPATGLIWQRCSVGQVWVADHCEGTAEELTWWKAIRAARDNQMNQLRDWRLPTRAELETLTDKEQTGYRHEAQALQTPAPNYAGTYWSSSLYEQDSTYAWSYGFNLALPYNNAKSYSLYVRLVRAGKPDQQYRRALQSVDQDEQAYLKGA